MKPDDLGPRCQTNLYTVAPSKHFIYICISNNQDLIKHSYRLEEQQALPWIFFSSPLTPSKRVYSLLKAFRELAGSVGYTRASEVLSLGAHRVVSIPLNYPLNSMVDNRNHNHTSCSIFFYLRNDESTPSPPGAPRTPQPHAQCIH